MTNQRSDVVVRPATAGETDDVARIWVQGWHDAHDGLVSAVLVAARGDATFRSRAAARIDDTLVAEIDGTVAGFVMITGDEIEQFYVSREARGRGVAGPLLTAAEELVGGRGWGRAWLAVIPENVRARRFYAARGWQDQGLFDYGATSGAETVAVPCHRYVKALDGTA